MTDGQIQNLIKANKVLLEDVLTNESFSLQDKEIVRDRLDILTKQLAFWTQRDNQERFIYDLKDQIRWMLKNTDGQIQNLMKANKVLLEDVLTNESFSLQDKEIIRDRLGRLTERLALWTQIDNQERFIYDLKDQIRWMLKNYS